LEQHHTALEQQYTALEHPSKVLVDEASDTVLATGYTSELPGENTMKTVFFFFKMFARYHYENTMTTL
jgi:hypothetical protein